jgi:hypothetical protein
MYSKVAYALDTAVWQDQGRPARVRCAIFDQNVVRSLNARGWNGARSPFTDREHERYLEDLAYWAAELNLPIDPIEHHLFLDGRGR